MQDGSDFCNNSNYGVKVTVLHYGLCDCKAPGLLFCHLASQGPFTTVGANLHFAPQKTQYTGGLRILSLDSGKIEILFSYIKQLTVETQNPNTC